MGGALIFIGFCSNLLLICKHTYPHSHTQTLMDTHTHTQGLFFNHPHKICFGSFHASAFFSPFLLPILSQSQIIVEISKRPNEMLSITLDRFVFSPNIFINISNMHKVKSRVQWIHVYSPLGFKYYFCVVLFMYMSLSIFVQPFESYTSPFILNTSVCIF